MSSTSSIPKIILILGAGPNVGAAVAKAFSARGFKVASASRSPPKYTASSDDGAAVLHIPVDLARPETVPGVFERVRRELGGEPGVVVYNAALFAPDPADPLSLFTPESIQTYHDSQAVNATSVLVSLHETVKAFRNLPATSGDGGGLPSKTFIFTGNMLNVMTLKGMLNFGLGKTAPAYAIRHLVEQKIYAHDGVTFYYADERTPEGMPVANAISGEAAAVEYVKLAERTDQGPWLYTFVKDAGYKDFERPGRL
ncbi:uncharacterized protein Z520_01317 [Fonsecaea multimorphosa CBS 102226]|uniref:Short-chain dehydrogenase n=1 Tax=Fonsecaea multimorphosa CBS 102226 TaxID=1442371 RepID=A0A0D2J0H5_9EURO|nr:uncharacterized protein Z520_01317 [Fonsecaea multimorphosa CBS 102226]KIY02852.1 hypothetical protein Z520_01317 [Fonsecaea multimorphosa CBS 102226]